MFSYLVIYINREKGERKMKNQKKLITCLGVIAVAVMGICTWSYMSKPVKAISFDVNPSFEIEINRFGNVARINTVNEDAKELLKGYDPTNEDLDDVVEVIMNRLIKAGYVKESQRNCIMVSGNKADSVNALKVVNDEVNEALSENNLKSFVLNQDIQYNEKMVEEAHKNNISFGKYAIIEKLLNDDDDNITLDELSEYSIDELIEFAKKNKLDVDELIDEYNDNLEDLLEDEKERKEEQAEEAREKKEDEAEAEEDRIEEKREKEEDKREALEDKREREKDRREEEEDRLEEEREAREDREDDRHDSDHDDDSDEDGDHDEDED